MIRSPLSLRKFAVTGKNERTGYTFLVDARREGLLIASKTDSTDILPGDVIQVNGIRHLITDKGEIESVALKSFLAPEIKHCANLYRLHTTSQDSFGRDIGELELVKADLPVIVHKGSWHIMTGTVKQGDVIEMGVRQRTRHTVQGVFYATNHVDRLSVIKQSWEPIEDELEGA